MLNNNNTNVHDTLLPEEEITPANKRVTSRFLTKFEIAAAISLRAKDIVSGQFRYGKCLVDNSKTAQDDEDELEARNKNKNNNTNLKKRKVEDDSDDSSNDDADSENNTNNNNKAGASSSFLEEDDNPMLAIENQARVKSMPMIYSDPVMIAKHELVQKKLPFVVKRCLGADMPPQSVLESARGKQKYRVEVIPIGELELDIRSIDLGEWMF